MNAEEKRRKLAADAARYLRQVGRKATPQQTNERTYDRELERKLKRMPPEDVDSLFRGED